MPDRNTSKQSLISSFHCAFAGLLHCSAERNFRIQFAFALLAVALGILLGISIQEWLAVLICIAAVLSLECLNTAIEATVDLASPQLSEGARFAKDSAAAAVLVASLISLIIAIFIFVPKLSTLIA